jgi:hypothetical protein
MLGRTDERAKEPELTDKARLIQAVEQLPIRCSMVWFWPLSHA